MHKDLQARRAVLVTIYRRYLEADRAWTVALRESRAWFPAGSRPGPTTIGNPDSPLRLVFDRRARALEQLQIARLKLEVAKRRLAIRR